MTTNTDLPRGLALGSQISVTGEHGRFTVKRLTGSEVTAWGGSNGREMMRTFIIDRIRTVHYRKPEPRRGDPGIDKGIAPTRNAT